MISPTPPGGRHRSGSTGCGRGAGFAVGAVLTGIVADLAGARTAIWLVAVLTLASGVVVARRMDETHRSRRDV